MVPATPAPDDLVLIAAYLEGDAGAFDAVFSRYHARVRATCVRHVGDEMLAEDLVQETFYNVLRALPRVDATFNFGAWVHRIAVNVCQDELRRRSRRAQHSAVGAADPDDAILRVPDRDRARDPAAALEMEGLRQLVWDVAKRLPERQRMVLTLRELQGLSYAAIARVMGVSEAAVETLLHRARRRFKSEYLAMESPDEQPVPCPELSAMILAGRLAGSDRRLRGHAATCPRCGGAAAAAGSSRTPAAVPA